MPPSLWCDPRVGRCVRLATGAFVVFIAAAIAACTPAPTLRNTRESPVAVAEAVVSALGRNDAAALAALSVDAEEFRMIVWPHLPAARPERNLTWQYVWQDLSAKSRYHAHATLAGWRTAEARAVEVRFGGPVEDHGSYRIHRRSVVHVRTPDGQEITERLFGSMIEQGGRFKVFSYVLD